METGDRPVGPDEPRRPIDDPRALQILTTEHWSLLTARSLVYNEAFARAGMFLAFLSATLLVLGLISTATGFSDAFLTIAAAVLALDLFVGVATLGRINNASIEDIRYLQGMNRLRHAYFEITPGLEPYFITSGYDDFQSVLAFYGPSEDLGTLRDVAHGLTTAPALVGVICGAVAGGLTAVLTVLLTHDPILATLGGLGAFGLFVGVMIALFYGSAVRFSKTLESKFPRPARSAEPPTS